MMMESFYTVDTVTPLAIKERAGDDAAPAKVLGGSSYTPVAGDRVIVGFFGGRFYIFGKA